MIEIGAPSLRARAATAFSAFRHPNYRLWFGGQLVSLLGSWMQGTAQGYFVYELTHSSAYLGYVAFASGIAPWFFMLYAGVIADRVSRRFLLLAAQVTMMVLAAAQAALTFSGLIEPWHIIVLSFLFGVANAFDAPARHSFVMELVAPEDLTNAIALNSGMFNLAVAIGPAVAGVTYALFGPAWCFLINALSFVAVILALLLMRLAPHPPAHQASIGKDFREGLHFAFGDPQVRHLLVVVIVSAVFGMSFVTLIPAWAVKILGGDATTNGYLQSARGIGALLGALSIAALGRFAFRGRLLMRAIVAFPLALLAFALVREPLVSYGLLILVGMGMMIGQNLCNSLIQTHTPETLRGRVMAIYSLSFFGFAPIGGLLAGSLAASCGETISILCGGTVCLCAALLMRLKWPGLAELP